MGFTLTKEMMVTLVALFVFVGGVALRSGPDTQLTVPEAPPQPAVQQRSIDSFPNLRQALPQQPPPPPQGLDLEAHLFIPIQIWSPATYPDLALPPLPRVGVTIPGGDLADGLAFPSEVRIPGSQLLQPGEESSPNEEGQ